LRAETARGFSAKEDMRYWAKALCRFGLFRPCGVISGKAEENYLCGLGLKPLALNLGIELLAINRI
jgi:hypothetical protein